MINHKNLRYATGNEFRFMKLFRQELLLISLISLAVKQTLAVNSSRDHITNPSVPLKFSSQDFTKLIQFGRIEPNWKDCPKDYVLVNNTCTTTLVESPLLRCDSPSQLHDQKCIHYSSKQPQCTPGYSLTNESCLKTQTLTAEITCPEGYQLVENHLCSKEERGSPLVSCPADATLINNQCFLTHLYSPTYACSPGYMLKDRQCIYENIFDCTPHSKDHEKPQHTNSNVATGTNLRVPINVISRDDLFISDLFHHPDTVFPSQSHIRRYRLPSEPSLVEEFVYKKTCKRFLKEPPRIICSQGGEIHEAFCRLLKQVPHVRLPGSVKIKTVPATYKCPPHYQFSDTWSLKSCVYVDRKSPQFVCYPGYQDVGPHCALYSKPSITCPLQYSLSHDQQHCNKVLKEIPYSYYTVTYQCQENNCATVNESYHPH